MDKKKKQFFEEQIKIKQNFDGLEIDMVTLAKQLGYETHSMKEAPQEIMAGIIKSDKTILVNCLVEIKRRKVNGRFISDDETIFEYKRKT